MLPTTAHYQALNSRLREVMFVGQLMLRVAAKGVPFTDGDHFGLFGFGGRCCLADADQFGVTAHEVISTTSNGARFSLGAMCRSVRVAPFGHHVCHIACVVGQEEMIGADTWAVV